jgi:multidrug resistance efflux pump
VTTPSANDLKSAQAAVDQAKAAVDLAKQNIANAKIVAPFDGTVLWVTPHLGESAAPSSPEFILADLTKMQVVVGVDETTLGYIKLGQTASLTSDSLLGKALTGRVSKIGLLATNTAGIINVPVTIEVDPSDAIIAPGLSASVEIQMSK